MAMGEEVKLYGAWFSPASLRVEMALKLKGIPYQYFEEDLTHKSSTLLQYNPIHKKVPLLLHKGKPILESIIIIQYIDETWKNNTKHILPTDPVDRAKARFWATFLTEQCGSPLFWACWHGEEKAMEEAHQTLKTLDDQIKVEEKVFAGDGGGLVEMAANCVAHWFDVVQEVTGVELITAAKYPTLCRWSEEYKTRALVKDFLPPREALLDHYRARFEIHRDSRLK